VKLKLPVITIFSSIIITLLCAIPGTRSIETSIPDFLNLDIWEYLSVKLLLSNKTLTRNPRLCAATNLFAIALEVMPYAWTYIDDSAWSINLPIRSPQPAGGLRIPLSTREKSLSSPLYTRVLTNFTAAAEAILMAYLPTDQANELHELSTTGIIGSISCTSCKGWISALSSGRIRWISSGGSISASSSSTISKFLCTDCCKSYAWAFLCIKSENNFLNFFLNKFFASSWLIEWIDMNDTIFPILLFILFDNPSSDRSRFRPSY